MTHSTPLRPAVLALALLWSACGGAADTAPAIPTVPPEPPAAWAALVSDYGQGADTLTLLEDGGTLVLQRWGGDRRALTLQDDSTLTDGTAPISIARDSTGRVTALVVDGTTQPRFGWGPAEGNVFRITPQRPVEPLREESLAATPPVEEGDFLPTDLVDLTSLDSTIRLDIRYAGTDNFMGVPLYSSARAFLQRPAAEGLARAHQALKAQGYGLLIHDGYRPWYVTRMFWEATPEHLRMFVADPSQGSRHNRGCAVDLTLYDLATGEPVVMPGVYDEMSPRSYPTYPGGTARQRALREVLRSAMEAEGFAVYETEWWHFDYQDWQRYRIGNQTFEELGR